MPEFESKNLSIGQLLLDPNNYRFHDDPNFVMAANSRFHDPQVQDRVWQRLRDDGLLELKNSILTNGFIPVEPLVCRNYEYADQAYVVVEGNRRLSALRWIKDDMEAGVEIDESTKAMLGNIPVIIVSHESDDPAFYEALMGVRHVSGIKEWGGYQRSNLVVVLKDDRNLETTEIADRLGMNAREVNRRYRAFKALLQMEEDEEYGDYATSSMYAIFHEAVSVTQIREWLEWSNEEYVFLNDENRSIFYDLITPNDPEEVGYREPKIRTFSDVRELRSILPNEDAKEVLLDPRRSFVDAVAVAKEAQISREWTSKVRSAISALDGLGFRDLRNLSEDQIERLQELSNIANDIIESHKKLTSNES